MYIKLNQFLVFYDCPVPHLQKLTRAGDANSLFYKVKTEV